MVLGYSVHGTDSGSLILGSSADDEVIQEGLLRLRSVSPTAPCAADFAKPHGAPRAMPFPGRKSEKWFISPTGFAARDVPCAACGAHAPCEGCPYLPRALTDGSAGPRRMRGAGARSCPRRGAASPREAAGPVPRGRLGAGAAPRAPPRPGGGRCPGEGQHREAPRGAARGCPGCTRSSACKCKAGGWAHRHAGGARGWGREGLGCVVRNGRCRTLGSKSVVRVTDWKSGTARLQSFK